MKYLPQLLHEALQSSIIFVEEAEHEGYIDFHLELQRPTSAHSWQVQLQSESTLVS